MILFIDKFDWEIRYNCTNLFEKEGITVHILAIVNINFLISKTISSGAVCYLSCPRFVRGSDETVRCFVFSPIGLWQLTFQVRKEVTRMRVTPNIHSYSAMDVRVAPGNEEEGNPRLSSFIPAFVSASSLFFSFFLSLSFFSSSRKIWSALAHAGALPRRGDYFQYELGVELITSQCGRLDTVVADGAVRRNITQTHEKDSTCTTRSALLCSRNFIYAAYVAWHARQLLAISPNRSLRSRKSLISRPRPHETRRSRFRNENSLVDAPRGQSRMILSRFRGETCRWDSRIVSIESLLHDYFLTLSLYKSLDLFSKCWK